MEPQSPPPYLELHSPGTWSVSPPGTRSSGIPVHGALILQTWRGPRAPSPPVHEGLVPQDMRQRYPRYVEPWLPGAWSSDTSSTEPKFPRAWSSDSLVHGAAIPRCMEPWHCNGWSPRLPSEEFSGTCSVWSWISLPGPSLRKEPPAWGFHFHPLTLPSLPQAPQDFTISCFSVPHHLV